MELYAGLMSGTSLDGIDAVLADFGSSRPAIRGSVYHAFPEKLRAQLLALNEIGNDELNIAASAANTLAMSYATAINELFKRSNVDPKHVNAIGCHGQTIRHRPDLRYTVQLLNGALLSELAGVDIVCDFRSRDIAAGGQGAPLVPGFHHSIFFDRHIHRVIINIGGIANITDLDPTRHIQGFDCGPGNILLDAWIRRHLGKSYDQDGLWARSGKVISHLLARLLEDEYFHRAPPKSTGRETFNLDWLQKNLSGTECGNDVQATLLQLTTHTIADAIRKHATTVQEVFICGGGARNTYLIENLRALLSPLPVQSTEALGIPATLVEALAFAWLARQNIKGLPGNLPRVTGAKGERILGVLHRAAQT
jgi:anhydro-N-acetylmuramic acid kinase